MRREGKVNGGKRNRPGHVGLCRRGPRGVREWDATSVPQSGSQVQQPGQGNSSWRSCRLPQPEGGCFASKTCKSSCRSCWPAETDRALVAGRGCGAEGSLSSKVSEQPILRLTFSITHWLPWLRRSLPQHRAARCLQGLLVPRGAISCSHSTKRECALFGP